MELCFEGSKGKNTQPLSISCPTVQRVPDGQMGGLCDLLGLHSNLTRVKKKQKCDSDFTICEIMVPVFYIKGRLSVSLHIFCQSPCTGIILANKFRLDFTSNYLSG